VIEQAAARGYEFEGRRLRGQWVWAGGAVPHAPAAAHRRVRAI